MAEAKVHNFARPKPGANFLQAVRTTRSTVRTAVLNGAAPKFVAHWGDFKVHFAKAQFNKCGFCEGPVIGLHYGDVEHYRPKSEISTLDHTNAQHWGMEQPWSTSVEGRKTTLHSASGYWWRAYSWSNYLLSCQSCNQQWKKCLFPISNRVVGQAPGLQIAETALLLNPFTKDPARHALHFLEFGRMGQVSAYQNSPEGHATILTCGLDRPSLRLARMDLALATHERIDDISADITERDLLHLLTAIFKDGHDRQRHCGMVRAIFCQRMGVSWADLALLIAGLKQTVGARPRRLCDC
jgi:hypothetical protein